MTELKWSWPVIVSPDSTEIILSPGKWGQYSKAEIWDFPVKTEGSRLIRSLLYSLQKAVCCFLGPVWHQLIHNVMLWIGCSPEIEAHQVTKSHFQSVHHHLSFSAATNFREKGNAFLITLCCFVQKFYGPVISPWALQENDGFRIINHAESVFYQL